MSCLLENQSRTVIENLIKNNNMTLSDATRAWHNSRTKQALVEKGLSFVSGMRCYWELQLELRNDPRWMSEPFDI